MAKQPKAKEQRRFGEVLVPRPKYQRIVEKRPYPPGEHGREQQYRRGRQSDYSRQLEEKQKLAFIYNVRDRQMRRYFKKAVKQKGPTGENLLKLLERRLDNLVYRAGYAATIWAARQLVSHRHVLVDGERVNIPSFLVAPGQTIQIHEKMRNNVMIEQWMEEAGSPPPYLELDRDNFSATLKYVPERDEIPVPVEDQLVVEYYVRRV